jgi:hypothetical protein
MHLTNAERATLIQGLETALETYEQELNDLPATASGRLRTALEIQRRDAIRLLDKAQNFTSAPKAAKAPAAAQE